MTGWSSCSLGDLCVVASGGTPARSNPAFFGGAIPWVKIGDMLQGVVTTTEETITEAALAGSAAKIFRRGSVLLSVFATVGRTATLGIDAATNQAIAGLSIKNENILDASFLRRFLDFKAPQLEAQSRGAAQANINLSILRAVDVPVPPLAEQRRIAAILDQADALRAKRRAALARLDEMAQAIFVEMFGDLSAQNCPWPRQAFEQIVVDARIGLVRSSSEIGPEHPHRYLKMDAIGTNGDLDLGRATRTFAAEDEVRAYSLAPGDFLFNTRNSRELVGKSAIFRSCVPHLFNNNIMRVRFRKDIAAQYVLAALRTPALQRALETKKSGTTSVFAIYWKDLAALQVPIPPNALQVRFVERMDLIRVSAKIYKRQGAELDALFTSLQHRAFQGEL